MSAYKGPYTHRPAHANTTEEPKWQPYHRWHPMRLFGYQWYMRIPYISGNETRRCTDKQMADALLAKLAPPPASKDELTLRFIGDNRGRDPAIGDQARGPDGTIHIWDGWGWVTTLKQNLNV